MNLENIFSALTNHWELFSRIVGCEPQNVGSLICPEELVVFRRMVDFVTVHQAYCHFLLPICHQDNIMVLPIFCIKITDSLIY